MMVCPFCGGKTGVHKTINDDEEQSYIIRVRQCKKCGRKFETTETVTREIYVKGIQKNEQ